MSDPDPIVAFLTERLDDEQQAAEAAEALNASPWSHRDGVVVGSTYDRETDYDLWDVEGTDFGRLHMHGPVAAHVAIHAPRCVLADVEAKRQLVRLHAPTDDDPGGRPYCVECQRYDGTGTMCPTIRLLAAPYRDHSDFDPSWAS